MSEYKLETKQTVSYPRCQIYRKFIIFNSQITYRKQQSVSLQTAVLLQLFSGGRK